ncbi:MAG TPA: hypothetical protein VJN43_23020 [Bryobacteraceae bacterium]|nr:hypothetical protein [Bryobacteraceae bacterium]
MFSRLRPETCLPGEIALFFVAEGCNDNVAVGLDFPGVFMQHGGVGAHDH